MPKVKPRGRGGKGQGRGKMDIPPPEVVTGVVTTAAFGNLIDI